MFSFLIGFLWSLRSYIFIVCIGNYITRTMATTSIQSDSIQQQEVIDNPQEPIITSKKRKRVKKKQNIKTSETDLVTNKPNNLIYTDSLINTLNVSDRNVTKIFRLRSTMSKFYVVNDSIFLDLEPTMMSDEEYHDYRLYKVMRTNDDGDVHRTDDELTEDDLTEGLMVTEELLEQGIIINNNVFLSHEQWHTIRRLSQELYSCTACQFQCDALAVGEHMSSSAHARTLTNHRPLKRFDLSIIRKINENFHCGVCNVIFPITSYRDHENSKSHESNLLFAINKVSDIMWDNQENKIKNCSNKMLTQKFCTNNIRDPNNAPCVQNTQLRDNSSDINTQVRDKSSDINTQMRDGSSSDIYSQMWDRPTDVDTQMRDGSSDIYSQMWDRPSDVNAQMRDGSSDIYFQFWDRPSDVNTEMWDRHSSDIYTQIQDRNSLNINTQMQDRHFSSDKNTQMRDRTESETNSIENIDYSRSEHNFNFGKSMFDVKIYEEEEIEEYTPPIEGVSYASMASKPRLNLPKFLKIDLGAKEVRVKFESWNMITQTNLNEYYCMVCTKMFPARQKTSHCLDSEHKNMLSKCAVVGAFEDYLIRDVSDKLYHCGHCNNLQYKNDMQIHVQKYHPIKNPKNPVETKLLPQKVSKEQVVTPKFDIFGDFKFCPFGVEITVSHLGCHTLMWVNNMYLCAICDVFVNGDLVEHVYEEMHMRLINMTPFVKPFQCNLTRAIRGSLHCAICNILIPVNAIYDHNMDSIHTNALARALGMIKKERPMQDIKYQPDESLEFKTELDRFLSTLPPDTRGALSRFKIKNHKGEMFQLSDATSSSASTSSNDTPTPISLNNSPVRQSSKPGTKVCYPKVGAEGIKQGLSYPTGADISKVGINTSYEVEREPNASHPQLGVDPIFYPKVRVDVIPVYPAINTDFPIFKPGQMLTLNMIESRLPRAHSGSHSVPLQATGPLQFEKSGVGTLPIRRTEDIEVANDLINFNNQSPAKHKVREPRTKVNEPKVESRGNSQNIPEKDSKKSIGKGKGQEKPTVEKMEGKKKKMTIESDDEELLPFKLEEPVLLKLKSSYFKVSTTAYHSLVALGDGSRRCFVCACVVPSPSLRRHVAGADHTQNVARTRFLYNFCGQLFRQMYLMYHCAICNVTMTRKEVKIHLEWRTHIDKYDQACKRITKKDLKDAIKYGAKEILVETQKEFLHVIPEPVISVVTYVQSKKNDFQEAYAEKKLEKKCQMIILKGNMMKISFESWHGILVTKSGVKCIICQEELMEDSLQRHLETQYHKVALGITFEKQYYPTLVRKINKNTVNCVICNLELPNDDSLVFEHINGRKHDKNYNAIIEKTSHTDSYSDCYKHPVTL